MSAIGPFQPQGLTQAISVGAGSGNVALSNFRSGQVLVYNPNATAAWISFTSNGNNATAVIPVAGTPQPLIPVPANSFFTVTNYLDNPTVNSIGPSAITIYLTPGEGQ